MRSTLSLLAVLISLTVAAVGQEPPPVAQKAKAVIEKHCHACHGKDGTNEGGMNFILNRERLVATRKIVPNDVRASRIHRRMVTEEMPPDEDLNGKAISVRPSKEEMDAVKDWIAAGAPEFNPRTAPRKFISNTEILEWILKDLLATGERTRRFYRYLTITHLYNAGLSDDELLSYRVGFSKLINSLSWGSDLKIPVPIDTAKTIFRIDLRDYSWKAETWEYIISANPYGVTYGNQAAKTCADLSQTQLPYVRADWFVFAASRPPLYHEVLDLPTTDVDLEKILRVDVATNIANEVVARAAFNGSGVSRNNRLIERHKSPYGAYWKSYDFADNVNRKNLFERPLGPGAEANYFKHDGGEIIFNLPNGLQAYFLTDGQGNRLDKGPITVVSDPKQADRSVVNGVSCMSCHYQGMIEKTDQVRDHVERNPEGFGKAESESIKAIYPLRAEFLKLLKSDAERFRKAVEGCGGHLSKTEPVFALAGLFEKEIDLKLAAAEVGVTPEDFVKDLGRAPAMARVFGPLRVAGGTVQRQVLVEHFFDLVATMLPDDAPKRIEGTARPSRPVIEPKPLVGGSTRHSTAGIARIDPPTLAADRVEISLPANVNNLCVGGGGRFLILHLQRLNQLAIFDVSAAKVVQYLPVAAEALFITAGAEHLLVVYPDKKVIERWSLQSFKKEATSPLPVNFRVNRVAMGSDSLGPLLLWEPTPDSGSPPSPGGGFANSALVDPLTLKKILSPFSDGLGGRHDPHNPQVEAAPDGSAFTCWQRRQPTDDPPKFRVMRIEGNKVTSKTGLSKFSPCFPSIDGGPVFTGDGNVFTGEMQPIEAPELRGAALLPIGLSYVVAARWEGKERKARLAVHFMNDLKGAFSIGDVEELDGLVTDRSDLTPFSFDKRIQFVPSANVLLTLPATNDRIVIHRVNVDAALKKSGVDFLFTTSAPVRQAVRSSIYSYQIAAKAKSTSISYKLDSGPAGMTLSSTGLLRWEVRPDYAGSEAAVIVAITSGSGQKLFHSFTIKVRN